MNLRNPILFAAIIVFAISACKKSGVKPATEKGVYIAGYLIASNGNGMAAYWKDGVAHKLTSDSLHISVANAIAVANGNVYVAGYTFNSNGDLIATLWKNGAATLLSNNSSEARGIAVSGQDVYITGVDNSEPVFWKNGAINTLSTSGDANAITIAGSDVYVAGGSYNSSWGGYVMTYWKNGAATVVGLGVGPANPGDASAILVNSTDVYVAGFEDAGLYLKNANSATLSPGTLAYPTGITLSGSDVYISGYVQANGNYQATYWKNDQAVQLSADPSFAVAIASSGSDVYIVGGIGSSAVYWKNGQLSTLAQYGYARGICIVN